LIVISPPEHREQSEKSGQDGWAARQSTTFTNEKSENIMIDVRDARRPAMSCDTVEASDHLRRAHFILVLPNGKSETIMINARDARCVAKSCDALESVRPESLAIRSRSSMWKVHNLRVHQPMQDLATTRASRAPINDPAQREV
jgi:hypothetical protein